MKTSVFSIACSSLALTVLACSPDADPGMGGDTSPGTSTGNTASGGNTAQGAGGDFLGSGAIEGTPASGGTSPLGTGGVIDSGAGGSNATGGDGNPGTGGDLGSGSGGAAPVEKPELVTTGQSMDSKWKVGTLTMGGTTANITVNTGTTYQTWSGFGGSFNEKGWDYMKSLSAADREHALRLLFDINEGAGFTFGRIPVGSSDYALSRYSLNETANDTMMTNFSIDRDKQDLIPYIKAALAIKSDIRFWASPWSPPTWMKDNNAFDKGNMKSDGATLDAHALYLARFVEEYKKEGITIEAIHPQNEPGFAQTYPSCLWSGSTMASYIADHLGPTFEKRKLDTEIWLGTMSNTADTSIVSAVMGNQKAKGYVKGIALQWGMGDGSAPSDYASQYKIPIAQSEHKCGNNPWEAGYKSTAPNDHAYAVESWGFFKNWIGKGVNSYMAWNMVLDNVGLSLDTQRSWAQNALLTVSGGKLNITDTYYVFRHLAQFVQPGAVRVAVQGGDALAFKNPDNSIITVMYNSGGDAATTLSVGGTMVQFTIPASGWATVNWKG